MSNLVNSVHGKVPNTCCVNNCGKGQCKVILPQGLSPRVVIDLDHCNVLVSRNATRCDYIVICKFSGDNWVVPLELTAGRKRSSKIVSQLQAGASIAEKVVCSKVGVKFRPVFAHCGIKPHERNDLRKKRVQFGQQSEIVRLIRCESKLTDAL